MPRYELYLCTDQGTHLRSLADVESFVFVRRVNSAGYFRLYLPGTFDTSVLHVDQLVQIWRAGTTETLRLVFVGFVRYWRLATDDQGQTTITVKGPGIGSLLERRIVAYAAGESETDKTDNADDMMKEIVDENLGDSATDTDRDVTDYGFSVAADLGDGPSITKAFAWRHLPYVLEDLAAASKEAGNTLMYEVVPIGPSSFQFQTWIDCRMDHSWPDGSPPVVFSLERGNLARPSLEYDFQDEINYVYAAGQGEGDERVTDEQEDTTRIGWSVWNRREGFQDARQCSTTACLQDAAYKKLTEGRPVRRFTADLLDAPGSRYALDWDIGDMVTVSAFGLQIDVLVQSVEVRISANQYEQIISRCEVED